jgi:hypothetical protein
MRLPDLLFQSADALECGDALLPEALFPILDAAREELDRWALQLEEDPHPPGLEGFDDSFSEAIDGFFEAIDLLELAVAEGVPELATSIKSQTQDAIDILRDIQERAESHHQVLYEELGERG